MRSEGEGPLPEPSEWCSATRMGVSTVDICVLMMVNERRNSQPRYEAHVHLKRARCSTAARASGATAL